MNTARDIDRICDEFEAAWQAGLTPSVDEFVAKIGEEQRSALLAELMALDLTYRGKLTETIDSANAGGSSRDFDVTIDTPNAALLAEIPDVTVDSEPNGSKLSEHSATMSGSRVKYFGEYELLSEIARGGMGVVYKARQVKLNRVVALKMILSGEFAGSEAVQRFQTEAEAAANLDHPGIVPIYEIGEHGGQHYFSMGFVDGSSLQGKLVAGPMPAKDAARLCRKIAEAVAYAHSKNVIHRDLKPANVLIDPSGEPKVTDFGLAKKVEGDSGLTRTGVVMGTPSYMPPEQALGQTDMIGPLADVYSLGAILYCMITGRPPFQAASVVDTLKQVIDSEPVTPRALDNKIPLDLETICLKCLEKNQGKRYASAVALVEDLTRYLDGRPITARPVSQSEQVWRWCRRHPAVASTMLAVIALLLVSVGAGFWINAERTEAVTLRGLADQKTAEVIIEKSRADMEKESAKQEAEKARQAESAAVESQQQAESARNQMRRHLYSAHMNVAYSNRELAPTLLELYKPQKGIEDIRGIEWFMVKAREDQTQVLGTHAAAVYGVAYSPEGKTLATVSGDSQVRLWDVQNERAPISLNGHRGIVYSVAYSPDGKLIVSTGNDAVKVWEVSSGREHNSIPLNSHWVSFARDGSQFATIGPTGTRLFSVHDGSQLMQIEQTGNTVDFSPDGRLLAVGGDELILWNVRSGEKFRDVMSGRAIESVAFSPDGKTLAFHPFLGNVELWDVESCTRVASFHDADQIRCLAFSADGTMLATGANDKNISIWDLQTSRRTATFAAHSDVVEYVAFSPDSRTLASVGFDKTVKVWPIDQIRPQMLSLPNSVSGLDIAPDSYLLAASCADGTVQLRNMVTGRIMHAISTSGSPIKSAAFASDGSTIVVSDGTNQIYLLGRDEDKFPVNFNVVKVVSSPAGRLIAAACADGAVVVWDTVRKERILKSMDLSETIMSLQFSPSGRQIAASDYYATYLWDLDDGTRITVRERQGAVFSLAFSPDGKFLALGDFDSKISFWNTGSKTVDRVFQGHMNEPASSLAFSSDGKRLASGGLRGEVHLWNTMDVDAIPTQLAPASGASVVGIKFSSDDSVLAATGKQSVHLWWSDVPRQADVDRTKQIVQLYQPSQMRAADRFCKLGMHQKSEGNLGEAQRSIGSAILSLLPIAETHPDDDHLLSKLVDLWVLYADAQGQEEVGRNQAVAGYRNAIRILESQMGDFSTARSDPIQLPAKIRLALAYKSLADSQRSLNNIADSQASLQSSTTHLEQLLEANLGDENLTDYLVRNRLDEALNLGLTGDHDAAAKLIADVAKDDNLNSQQVFATARTLGFLHQRVLAEESDDRSKRGKWSEHYSKSAISLLLQLRDGGFFNEKKDGNPLKEDPAFKSIRATVQESNLTPKTSG